MDFSGQQTIDEIDVLTVADYPTYYSDPTATHTFTQYGATAYDVQYWTGSAWATVSGGSVTGNSQVWRRLNFTAVTTTKIRVVVSGAVDGVVRIAEVEAWTAGGAGGGELRWLVADQLGTPRMVVDKSGSLSGVSRHDYLPFGEEIGGGIGGRTTQHGYGVSDNVRQKYAGSERDGETGLDYMKARYYSSALGRFTGVDPSSKSIIPANPQTWNRYSYSYNNSLRYVDKNGKWPTETHNALIDKAFPGLTARERHQIKKGSEITDYQTAIPSEAHKHAMRMKGESVEEAFSKARAWVDGQGENAKMLQADSERQGRKGLALTALVSFGAGSHTLMDTTSPTHRDFQEYGIPNSRIAEGAPRESGFIDTIANSIAKIFRDSAEYSSDMQKHVEGESRPPTPEEEKAAIDSMRNYFRNVFGEEAYQRAIKAPEESQRHNR